MRFESVIIFLYWGSTGFQLNPAAFCGEPWQHGLWEPGKAVEKLPEESHSWHSDESPEKQETRAEVYSEKPLEGKVGTGP